MDFFFSRKKYLISGIGPGPSGVGRLMNVLVPEYSAKGYTVISRKKLNSLRPFIDNKDYLHLFREVFARCLDSFSFYIKCLGIFRSEIIFLHPQTAGYPLFFLLSYFNDVRLYVMDNSFFCISSYNTHPITKSECLECVGNPSPHRYCSSSPVKIPKLVNILYLKFFLLMSSRLKFLAQNNLQRELLYMHFGKNIDVLVVGMSAERGSLVETSQLPKNEDCNLDAYDVVFHGASNAAKGIFYVLEIARLLPELSFLIPDKRSEIIRITNIIPSSNVACISMTWETGLRETVLSARLVLNPSMWSAPIEGALIKSALFNKNVATVCSQFAYEAEISSIINHLRLPSDAVAASKVLRDFFAVTD